MQVASRAKHVQHAFSINRTSNEMSDEILLFSGNIYTSGMWAVARARAVRKMKLPPEPESELISSDWDSPLPDAQYNCTIFI